MHLQDHEGFPWPDVDFVRWFRDIGLEDVPLVGGKNASLGELARALASAGRAYVKAYVEFIHYVERVYEASTRWLTVTYETKPVVHER